MKSVTDATVALAVSTLKAWLSEIYPPKQVDRCITVGERLTQWQIRAKIWTATNEHTITATIEAEDGRNPEDALAASYLGASSVSRLQRPGETWNRGNDLPDGRFSAETWRKILAGIVRYEAQEIKSTSWREKRWQG
jgi:hypothetical protein